MSSLRVRSLCGRSLIAFLACVSLLPVVHSAAAPVSYTSRRWQTDDGLPHNSVQAIAQTRDGYLWIGTREGLARFDGVQFTPFQLTPGTRSPSVNALCETADGALWVGTDDRALFCLRKGKLTRYSASDGLLGDRIDALAASPDGGVWILTNIGIARFQKGKISIPADVRLRESARGIYVTRDGALWVVDGNNLKRVTDQGTTVYTTANGLASNYTRSILETRNGDLWIGYDGGMMEKVGEKFIDYPKGAGPSAMVGAIYEERDGNLWIGTYDGLYRFIEQKYVTADRQEDTPYESYVIYEDREGNIWVGGDGGLQRFTPKRFVTYTEEQGLTYNKTACLCSGIDGALWIGTWGGGLNRLKDGKVTAYTRADGLANDFVHCIYEARNGALWFGLDFSGGVYRLENGKLSHFGKEEDLRAATMTVIHEDESGNIWVGTRDGLYLLRDDRFTRYYLRDGLTHKQVNALAGANDGGFWIGGQKGLTRYRDGRFQAVTPNGEGLDYPLIALYEDPDGTLWIGTDGYGLKRLEAGKLESFTMQEGLVSNVIYSIQEDERGALWMSSSRGIFSVTKRDFDQVANRRSPGLTPVRFGRADGIATGTQNHAGPQPAACKDNEGRLWFRMMRGVAATDLGRIARNPLPPPVIIEQVLADRQAIFPPDESAAFSPAARQGGNVSIIVSPGNGELDFRYTALSLTAADRNQFKYQLEGVDPGWVDAGTRREAHYHTVPPGSYRFRVLACNNDGVWNESGAEVAVTLRPHIWQTWWFLGGVVFAVAALIAFTVRSVTRRRMQRELDRLERQQAVERERARIAQDIHDELGASLTEISMLAAIRPEGARNAPHLTERLGRIAETSHRVVESLDAIVWTVDPGNDNLASLGSYLASYATDYLLASGVNCRLDLPAELPCCEFSADIRHHLLMAVRETLTNAVRHSGASEVWLRMAASCETLEISVRDNGRGFDASEPKSGHGLVNLRARLSKLEGKLTIESNATRGTCVRFIVPLPLSSPS